MENLGDILRRLRDSRSANGDQDGRFDDAQYQDQPSEVCTICEGRLWLAIDVPVGHPDFGKAAPCPCQSDAVLAERSSRLRRYSNLGPLSRRTFDSIDPAGRSSDAENSRLFRAAFEAAEEYAANPVGWLVFTGPNGSGKTHLAAAIANRNIEIGRPVFFVHVPDLLDDLRATFSPTSELSYSDLFEQVNQAPLLVMDGLASGSPTPWALEKLQQIFNHRYNSELPTVVTTAVDAKEIDPYIASRLFNPRLSRVLDVAGRVNSPARQLGRTPQEMLSRMTFETFNTQGHSRSSASQRASLTSALDAARSFAADPDGWLTLFGDTGVGKTHLAVAIAGDRLRRGHPVFFAFVPELMDYLRHTFRPDSSLAYDSVFDEVKNARLLILDDLNNAHLTDWAYEKLYQLLVHRHNSRMPTVITSPIDLMNTSGPISSRTQDQVSGNILRMEALDYRIGRNARGGQGTPEHQSRKRR